MIGVMQQPLILRFWTERMGDVTQASSAPKAHTGEQSQVPGRQEPPARERRGQGIRQTVSTMLKKLNHA